jgi:hypothetical protein
VTCRHHLHHSVARKALSRAVTESGMNHNALPVIHSGIVLLLSCYVRAGIFVPCKSYWVIRMVPPRRSIPM